MLQNYLKIALRGLLKHRAYSLINISGLAVGMAVTLLIGLWVHHEYSFDRFLPDYERLYQLRLNISREGKVETGSSLPLPVTNVLRDKIPGIEHVAECDWMQKHGLMAGEQKLFLSGARIGGDFLKMFRFPLLQGDPEQVLYNPNSIVLTERTAQALFGNEDPMGKTVRFDNRFDLKVSGILQNLPANSTFFFNYLVPFALYEQNESWVKEARSSWQDMSFQVFVSLAPKVTAAEVAPRIRDLVKDNLPVMAAFQPEVLLHAYQDWHLYNEFENGRPHGGYIDYVRIFSLIGILVLLIACINFTNLATARSEKRAKEVGVRKAIGSKRKQLIFQFLTESFLLTLCAAVLAIFLLYLSLPAFNTLLESEIQLPFREPLFWLLVLAYTSLTALLAGSRPALFLSSFKAVQVLKGNVQIGSSATLTRKVLVLAQFSCSIALIIGTLVIYRQIHHVKDRPVGYDQNRLLMTRMSEDLNENYDGLKNDLLNSGLVESVAWGSSPVTSIYSYTELEQWPGKKADALPLAIGLIKVTDSYFSTVGMELVNGRGFHENWRADSNYVIINEAAAERLQLSDPINQPLTFNGGQQGIVLGVVKDALMTSPFSPPVPSVFLHGRWGGSILYRLSDGVDTQEALKGLSDIFSIHNPTFPYEYEFVDQLYAQKFRLEVLIGRLSALFAGLAIFVSCLGLFGLAAYMAEQRRKEIGIRKILGASLSQIWLLLTGEFVWLVILSCVIASPLALYFLNTWLQAYPYRIDLGPGVFVVAAVIALAIALLTISFQALKAGRSQPVESLRTE